MAITQLTGKQIKDQSIDLTTDVTGVLPTANGGTPQYILLQDQKTSGTNGGSITTTNWFQRDLNSIVNDDTGLVTLSSNSFTLPEGTYEVNAASVYYFSNGVRSRIRLYNQTDSTAVILGLSTTGVDTTTAFLNGKFTINSSKTMRIDSRFSGTEPNTEALGKAMSNAGEIEIYTQVELRKVS